MRFTTLLVVSILLLQCFFHESLSQTRPIREEVPRYLSEDPRRFAADQPCIIGARGFRGSHGVKGDIGDRGHIGTPGIFHTLTEVIGPTIILGNGIVDNTAGALDNTLSRATSGRQFPRRTESTLFLYFSFNCTDVECLDFSNETTVNIEIQFGFCQCVPTEFNCPDQIGKKSNTLNTFKREIQCLDDNTLANGTVTIISSVAILDGKGSAFVPIHAVTPGEAGTEDEAELSITLSTDPSVAGISYDYSGTLVDVIYYDDFVDPTGGGSFYESVFPDLDEPWNPIDFP